jgi:hypothetical protein
MLGFSRISASGSPDTATRQNTKKLATAISGIEVASRRRMKPPMGYESYASATWRS